MATYAKLPSGSWRTQVSGRRGQRVSKTFKHKADALAWAKKMEADAELLDGFASAAADRRTVAQAIDSFMMGAGSKSRDASLPGRLSWWRERFGDLPLAELTSMRIRDGLRELAEREAHGYNTGTKSKVALGRGKLSPATLNRYRAALGTVLKWALKQDWIVKNPAKGLGGETESRGRVRYLSDEERQALFAACDQSKWPDLRLFVALLLSTGARLSEVRGLRWQDLDLKKGTATLHDTKNGERRLLSLVKPVRERLQARVRPIIGSALLFPSRDDPEKPYSVRKPWDAAVAAAKLVDFRIHDLRHSAASYLAMNGATLIEVAAVLGHKSTRVTLRYAHLNVEHKQKVVEAALADKV